MRIEEKVVEGRRGFRPAEIAGMYGISLGLVRLEMRRGTLRGIRVGKRGLVVTREALEEWLRRGAEGRS